MLGLGAACGAAVRLSWSTSIAWPAARWSPWAAEPAAAVAQACAAGCLAAGLLKMLQMLRPALRRATSSRCLCRSSSHSPCAASCLRLNSASARARASLASLASSACSS